MISINAYDGAHRRAPASDAAGPERLKWLMGAIAEDPATIKTLAPPPEVDLNDWAHEDVGWGVIVVAKAGFSLDQYASGEDIKHDSQLQRLLDYRRQHQPATPVFHYNPLIEHGPQTVLLRNYCAGRDLDFASKIGIAADRIPFYLLIYASPSDIPWNFQATLQVRHAVGRLDPGMTGLNYYIDHLISGWPPDMGMQRRTVVWTVDQGDITSLMRQGVALKLHEKFAGDSDLEAVMLDPKAECSQGSASALVEELTTNPPGLIVTCSHGKTGPLDDEVQMTATMGLPVDQNYNTLDLDELLRDWTPSGAVWFAQACCSAGSDKPSRYEGLFSSDSEIGTVLDAIAGTGAHISPLPQRLLGSKKPARGFFGQIEPTFNITLQNPSNGQLLSSLMVEAFYNRYFGKYTLGRVLNEYHRVPGTKVSLWYQLMNRANKGENVENELLYIRTTAVDMESLVLIGDPAASFDLTTPPVHH